MIMYPAVPDSEYGVLIGRLQTHCLHQAYRDIIETICHNHRRVVVLLGIPPVVHTRRNPLSFEARKQMILEAYPNVTVLGVPDAKSDKVWVHNLESTLRGYFPIGKFTLYGSRDAFVNCYLANGGKFNTVVLQDQINVSSTEFRKAASLDVINSEDFRAGVIHAAFNRYKSVISTVDIAVLGVGRHAGQVLMARKPNETLLRLFGGHVEPDDPDLETAATREGWEEGKKKVGALIYICSLRVDDWRWRSETDKIMTVFFAGYESDESAAEAGDDVSDAAWVHLGNLREDMVEPEHQPLARALLLKMHEL
jgi:bifunctional NMN adenylyltransferase/nudix hydrolase